MHVYTVFVRIHKRRFLMEGKKNSRQYERNYSIRFVFTILGLCIRRLRMTNYRRRCTINGNTYCVLCNVNTEVGIINRPIRGRQGVFVFGTFQSWNPGSNGHVKGKCARISHKYRVKAEIELFFFAYEYRFNCPTNWADRRCRHRTFVNIITQRACERAAMEIRLLSIIIHCRRSHICNNWNRVKRTTTRMRDDPKIKCFFFFTHTGCPV